MKILIDADGCPVVNQTIEIAVKFNVKCIIICDTSHHFDRKGAETIVVDKGADSADFRIVNLVEKDDIIITQDYGLAAMCLARKGIPVNQDGLIYNSENIETLLDSRYITGKIRAAGGRSKGPSKRMHNQDVKFINTLENLLSNLD